MDERIRDAIADEGWLFVAILTLALTSLAGLAGLGALAGVITIVGWFVLTPILLFWGDEVALMLGDDEPTGATRTGEPESDSDPLEELKRRYAAGEIDDAEFERRLERLVAVDEIPDDAIGTGTADAATETEPLEHARDRERERERER
ncbi:SHOCT domain-containing protein [Haloterrigena sp. SYSU A121-1]|uniref:SHOCT domain-containing protein n=1 Tax=Haloterrigena gelatinilytica TaxID=2741724 RepID=A0A8J8KIV4_9EURY|nr:SHOCT domain-containing protein [Haloterrigena gelatinilytica]NUB92654.1 SHOCT domain-containing protein [Haloterrigena gelatinilytica]